MKKVLALVIALVLLVAMAPIALAADVTVNVSVSVDGKLLVAAQPVTVSDATVQGVIVAAHKAFYSGGEAGYAAGIDPTYNMFLINTCWGIKATPYVAQNNEMLQKTADTAPVVAGDNILICTSSDSTKTPAAPATLAATVSGDKTTITATAWTLDFTTFTYKSAPLASAAVTDGKTGAALGTTDASGKATVATPASGIIAVGGVAAIAVAAGSTAAAPATTLPKTDGVSTSTILGFVGLGLIAVGATMFVFKKKSADQAN
jgi:LPXTG-motif cell wall-anchored protein